MDDEDPDAIVFVQDDEIEVSSSEDPKMIKRTKETSNALTAPMDHSETNLERLDTC